ncbi:MAG: IspD/TarI family cytidylyltransferase [Brevinemataceae bacterium]
MIKTALIVAGGSGTRFGSTVPKQFTKINNTMVINYSINLFIPIVDIVMVALPEAYKDIVKNILQAPNVHFCTAGTCRQETVFLGLKALEQFSPDYSAIHDAARPIITTDLINNSFKTACTFDSAVPVVSITDSLWQTTSDSTIYSPVNRELFVYSQTPQTFNFKQILEAHTEYHSSLDKFSDCASVYMKKFKKIYTYEGCKNNIKLTVPSDLKYAEFLLLT